MNPDDLELGSRDRELNSRDLEMSSRELEMSSSNMENSCHNSNLIPLDMENGCQKSRYNGDSEANSQDSMEMRMKHGESLEDLQLDSPHQIHRYNNSNGWSSNCSSDDDEEHRTLSEDEDSMAATNGVQSGMF